MLQRSPWNGEAGLPADRAIRGAEQPIERQSNSNNQTTRKRSRWHASRLGFKNEEEEGIKKKSADKSIIFGFL